MYSVLKRRVWDVSGFLLVGWLARLSQDSRNIQGFERREGRSRGRGRETRRRGTVAAESRDWGRRSISLTPADH
ncbi:hypothetical protein GY45DRAFT_47648 [Cubamyces sp. BRFM 1775]|nr:hypothetical protein GY45DRAFT_47648 [Cubamyces sp. BRFM 1775]